MIIAKGLAEIPPVEILEDLTDPVELERRRAAHESGWRNADWLQYQWEKLLPQAYGKFVAVASEEAFVADTSEEAWSWVDRANPEDTGALVRYVMPPHGPLIYANRRTLV